jgi:hypothetical protein
LAAMAQMHGKQSFFILVAYFMQIISAILSSPPVSAAFLHG